MGSDGAGDQLPFIGADLVGEARGFLVAAIRRALVHRKAEYETVGRIAQLADIARPFAFGDLRDHFWRYVHRLTAVAPPGLADELEEQQRDILLALRKRRGVFTTLFYTIDDPDTKRIEDILATIRLTARKNHLAADLSHGQKQWLEVGMLLAQDPKLLLVDEPVAGMTDAETIETAKLLKEIAQTRSVVVVEHDMSFVRELGCRVTCLAEGTVLAEGTLDQVSANPVVIERYLGR